MVFSSIIFVFFFLPIFLFCYYTLPFKNIILLIFSLLFYAWGEPVYILLLLFSSIVDFTIGKLIEEKDNKKFYLAISIIVNMSMLGFFKYFGFLIDNINSLFNISLNSPSTILPIGISFFTFQTMSYSIDIYRKKFKAERNFLNFLTYVTMFPQLIAGPIVRYEDIHKELHERKQSLSDFTQGFKIFLEGMFLKVLLANNAGLIYNMIIDTPLNELSVLTTYLAVILFMFQIYFDFSGYSLMAIGIGKMIGFNYPTNFNYPFISTSISEFWRRWHMTLGSWFRDYIYIPLGGNKKHFIRNLFIVWLFTGLWHGASWNYILWGLYFGILLYLEKCVFNNILDKTPVIIKRIVTFYLLTISFYIFAFESSADLINYGKILFLVSDNSFINDGFLYYMSSYGVFFIILLLFVFGVRKLISERVEKSYAFAAIYLLLFILSISYLVSSAYNPFLYFRF